MPLHQHDRLSCILQAIDRHLHQHLPFETKRSHGLSQRHLHRTGDGKIKRYTVALEGQHAIIPDDRYQLSWWHRIDRVSQTPVPNTGSRSPAYQRQFFLTLTASVFARPHDQLHSGNLYELLADHLQQTNLSPIQHQTQLQTLTLTITGGVVDNSRILLTELSTYELPHNPSEHILLQLQYNLTYVYDVPCLPACS